jgi:hypothetical protein
VSRAGSGCLLCKAWSFMRAWLELVDALVSEISARKGVGVRLSPCAPWRIRLVRLMALDC